MPRFEGALLWDLDGTLLTTAKAGRIALRAAIAEQTGIAPDLDDLNVSGLTDLESVAAALRGTGIAPDPALLARVREGYEGRLPETLLQREGTVLPGVVEALEELALSGRVVSLLLTGNTEGGARAKLERYGLRGWFRHGGAFCEGGGGRLPIGRRALELARSLIDDFTHERILLIGDTPKDVECARAIGVRALGVASGAHSTSELATAGAWRSVDAVPNAMTLEQWVLDWSS